MVYVPEQGKGHAVRTAFVALTEFDILVLTDGDGTYPAEAAPLLVAQVRDHESDMAVGARHPEPGAGAMSVTRGLGNGRPRAAFRILIDRATRLLCGYRLRPTVSDDRELSHFGLRDETELSHPRLSRRGLGSSKSHSIPPRNRRHPEQARAFRDGWRILGTIVTQSF